ncbi:MAG: leukotoxin LktA family filamentous adhesin, partial [Candidatus Riflebacteria bacterium]|nr:leukotoxin LktA family filamentous adhesin [Candidatus Riflebacteria bacterium]
NNLINFVKNKIDIQGTLNAVRNNKIGGNLYFLSSEGLILGKGGVINAGAFYAMTPTKEFMEKFIPTDNTLNLTGVNVEIGYILDRKISDYNSPYTYGVNINPLGEIVIEGKINTINGIGLYSGGKDKEDSSKQGLVVKDTAKLTTLTKDELGLFVNLDGINLPEANDIVNTEGNIELVSVQNNTHHTSSIGKYTTGYSNFIAASASARIEMNGSINSRNKTNLTSYASNGSVKWITEDGKRSFDGASKISDVYSTVIIGGTIKSKDEIGIKAMSESDIQLDKMNVTSMLLELSGQAFFPFPLNIDANVVVSNTNSSIDIKKSSILESEKSVNVKSHTISTSIAGADTSLIVLEKASDSKFNWLPEVSSIVVISDASSKVDFDGTAISKLNTYDDKDTKAISVISQSDNTLQSTSTAVSMDSQSALDAAITVGKFSNKALMNVAENAKFLTPQMVEIAAIANNKNSISSKTSIGNTAYAAPAVSISIFDSEATGNYGAKFDSTVQIGSFTFRVEDNILSDKLNASSGIASMSPIFDDYHRIVKKTLEGIYSKFKINTVVGDHLPNQTLAKFSVAGALAYGGGKHTATLNIKPGSKLTTTGDLILKSSLNVEDTKYNASSKAKANTQNENGAKVETALSLLITDYDYKSDIILDDSLTNAKTKISGKSIVIESTVYQPYQRPQKMWEELVKGWERLKAYFTKAEHQEIINKISAAFKKLGDSNAIINDYGFINKIKVVFTDLIDGLNSLWEFAKLEGFVLSDDAIVSRLFKSLYDVIAFKEYSNYLNNSVSSSVLSTKANDTVDISGSIFVGKNTLFKYRGIRIFYGHRLSLKNWYKSNYTSWQKTVCQTDQ